MTDSAEKLDKMREEFSNAMNGLSYAMESQSTAIIDASDGLRRISGQLKTLEKERIVPIEEVVHTIRTLGKFIGLTLGFFAASALGLVTWQVRATILLEERQARSMEALSTHSEFRRSDEAALTSLKLELVELTTKIEAMQHDAESARRAVP